MGKVTYPKHAYKSVRAFKAEKRADMRAALRAIDQLRMGCFYVPGGHQIIEAMRLLEQARYQMRADKWGR